MSSRFTAIRGVAIAAVSFGLSMTLQIRGAAAADGLAQARLGGDVFVAGGALTVRDPVAGDLFAAGGSTDVDAAVSGDVLAAGGKVRLGADVGQSVYAAAGQLTVNGKVGRNARVAGGQFELGPKAEVLGNLSVAGGQVRLLGAVRGHVQAAGGRLLIDGTIGGDVLATTGHVELGPNARIAGKLRYHGSEAVQQDPSAQVAGGIESWASGWGSERGAAPSPPHPARAMRPAIGWPWTIGLVLLAAVLLAALPVFYDRVARTLQERPGLSLLLGFVWLVCAPVALLLLLITVIGIPLALLGAALYVALLPLAYVSTAIALGDWALRTWRVAVAAQWAWRLAAAAIVLILLAQAARVPWLGGLVTTLALLAGLGALALQLRRRSPAA
jgi:cytoskeletal protein CcmA (bactofilin family)